MSSKRKDTFIVDTDTKKGKMEWDKVNYYEKFHSKDKSSLTNYTNGKPVSKLPIHTSVEPSMNSVTRV